MILANEMIDQVGSFANICSICNICSRCFPEKLSTDCFGYLTDLPYLKQLAIRKLWLGSVF